MYIASFALLGYIFFAWQHTRQPLGYLPLCVVSFLTLGSFAAAMGGVYSAYVIGAGVLGLALLAASLGEWLFARRRPIASHEDLALAALLGMILLFFPWYFTGAELRYYDEFFWGAITKVLLEENGLLTALSPLAHTSIPLRNPAGPAVFQGLFMPFGFEEGAIGVAGMVLVWALACVVVELVRSRLGLFRALLLGLLCACLTRCMGVLCTQGVYLMGYTEYLQSSVFGALLAVALLETRSNPKYFLMLPALGLLTLFKATGFLFALGVVACALAAQWRPLPKTLSLWRGRLPLIRSSALFLLPIVLVKLIVDWQMYHVLLQPGSQGTVSSFIPSPEVALSQSGLYLDSLKALLLAFYGRPILCSSVLSYEIMSVISSPLSLLLQWTAAFWALRRYARVSPTPPQCRVLLFLLLGLLGWISLRYLISVQGHAADEALRAASFERYVGAYMAGCAVVATLVLHGMLAQAPSRAARFSKPLLLGQTLLLLLLCGFTPWMPPRDLPPQGVRPEMERAAAWMEPFVPPQSRIWFINQNTDNQKIWALRYVLTPERMTGFDVPWSLGAPYDAQDRYSSALPPENLRDTAQRMRMDYLLLWDYDARFLQEYGPALGLHSLGGPRLLRLKDWRDGKTAVPERVK